MKKRTVLMGGTGLAALLAGGTRLFFEVAIPRNSRIPHLKKKENEEGLRQEIEQQIGAAIEWLREQKTEQLTVRSYDGLMLKGTLFPADVDAATKIILAVHGYRNRGEREFAAMAPFFHRLGYHLVLVDDRAHGESEGDYIGYGWQDHFDCETWIDYLIERFGKEAEIVLYGISMGAATVMITAGDRLPGQVKGVIADCGYTSAMDQFRFVLKTVYHLPAFPLLPLTRRLTRRKAGYDFEDCDAKTALGRAELPFLFIHGDRDDFVPTSMGKENFEACTSKEKEFLLIEGAGHAQSYFVDTKRYEKAVEEFLSKLEK
ncbi:MAG: alpha/beta hydrolase [Lachnospiraceae bacterium]|nr:alpha/beta hydrolase [Lachnospiraceae bacterium]